MTDNMIHWVTSCPRWGHCISCFVHC